VLATRSFWSLDATPFRTPTRHPGHLTGGGDLQGPEIRRRADGADHAYVVSPDTLHRFAEDTTWRWPSEAIAPGLHWVDIALRAGNGAAALIRLKIMNPGRDATLKVFLRTRQLVS